MELFCVLIVVVAIKIYVCVKAHVTYNKNKKQKNGLLYVNFLKINKSRLGRVYPHKTEKLRGEKGALREMQVGSLLRGKQGLKSLPSPQVICN